MSIENTHYNRIEMDSMLKNCNSIFFIGIGGVSMSALAEMSRALGYRVGGSDRTRTETVERMEADGFPIFNHHSGSNIAGFDAVVYTVAIGEDNPEYAAAMEQGLPLISRANYLGFLMTRYETRVGIAGMHGKSTCTAMCSRIFMDAKDSTVLCGAEMPELGNKTYHIGKNQADFVFEACEYMDSFLDFCPTLPVILNIGLDHVDYFHGMEEIRTSFRTYAEKSGCVVCNADDKESQIALQDYAGRKITFGMDAPAEYTARNICHEGGNTRFDFFHGDEKLCNISLQVFGKHNIYNALAAATVACECGITPAAIADSLAGFKGAKRRMEYKGTLNGAAVYEDYGHHPDEIRATLQGAKEMGFDRILCAFQPHTYSRTAGLLEEFSKAFGDAERVFLADIYAAREQNIFGVTSETLVEKIGNKATYCGSFQRVAEQIKKEAHPRDLVIVMGAGDIYKVFDFISF